MSSRDVAVARDTADARKMDAADGKMDGKYYDKDIYVQRDAHKHAYDKSAKHDDYHWVKNQEEGRQLDLQDGKIDGTHNGKRIAVARDRPVYQEVPMPVPAGPNRQEKGVNGPDDGYYAPGCTAYGRPYGASYGGEYVGTGGAAYGASYGGEYVGTGGAAYGASYGGEYVGTGTPYGASSYGGEYVRPGGAAYGAYGAPESFGRSYTVPRPDLARCYYREVGVDEYGGYGGYDRGYGSHDPYY